MVEIKFNPKKLKKLNNPDRYLDQPPELIWGKFDLKDPKILVDIGAGTGFFSIPFLQRMSQGKIFACDISDVMLQWMVENVCKTHPNIIPKKMEESKVDLPDGEADLVFMFNLHHELKDPEALLGECHRLLKPKGRIAVIDWIKKEMNQGPPESIRCLPEEVAQQMKDTRFDEVEILTFMPKHFMVIATKT